MNIRVGQGLDVYRWTPLRPLRLGGVEIAHSHGLLGHSDADVLLHAICDALLGAAGLGDIGHHFPDHDPALAGIDSRILVQRSVAAIAELGWRTINLDSILILQRPKIAPHVPEMRKVISALLFVTPEQVNVKATTTEGLGFTGRQEGVTAMATVLIQRA